MSLPLGTVVDGKFEIRAQRGLGSFGIVYEAMQLTLERKVALKILREVAIDETGGRFMREANILANLRNKHLPSIYGYGLFEDRPYIALEWIDGSTLSELLLDKEVLSAKEAVSIIIQLCEGLRCAHEHGIVHRDLKPDNILLQDISGDRVLRLLDFGLARVVTDSAAVQRLTNAGSVVGTLAYMSPENCMGAEVTAAADIYAVGCLMVFCLTGRAPFSAADDISMMWQHVNGAAPHLTPVKASADSKVVELCQAVVNRCLMKDPEDRWQSCDELLVVLRQIATGLDEIRDDIFFCTDNSGFTPSIENLTALNPRERKASQYRRAVVLAAAIGIVSAVTFQIAEVSYHGMSNRADEIIANERKAYETAVTESRNARLKYAVSGSALAEAIIKNHDSSILNDCWEQLATNVRQGHFAQILTPATRRVRDCFDYEIQRLDTVQRGIYCRYRALKCACLGDTKKAIAFLEKGKPETFGKSAVLGYFASFVLDADVNVSYPRSLEEIITYVDQQKIETYYSMPEALKAKPENRIRVMQSLNRMFWRRFGSAEAKHDDKTMQLCRRTIENLDDQDKGRLLRWQLTTMYALMLADRGRLDEAEKTLDGIVIPPDSCARSEELNGFIQARLRVATTYLRLHGSDSKKPAKQWEKLMAMLETQPRIPQRENLISSWRDMFAASSINVP